MSNLQAAVVGVADTQVGVVPGRSPTELCVEAALCVPPREEAPRHVEELAP